MLFDSCVEGIIITDPYHINNGKVKLTQFVIGDYDQCVSVICRGDYDVKKNDVVRAYGEPRRRTIRGRTIEEFRAEKCICLQSGDI